MISNSVSSKVKVIRPIVAARITNPRSGREEAVYALYDTGADTDYISSSLAQRLGLELNKEFIELSTAVGEIAGNMNTTTIKMRSMDGGYEAMIQDCLVGPFPNSRDIPPAKRDWSSYEHLKDIEFVSLDASVEIIISSAHIESLLAIDSSIGRKNQGPKAIKTMFGWTVAGSCGRKTDSKATVALLSVEDRKLKEDLQKIFTNDFPPIMEDELQLSREAKYALEQLEDTIKWDAEKKKYSVGLPYKQGREKSAQILRSVDSKSTAEKRAWSLKRSMEKVEGKREKGFSEMKKFLEKGRAERLSPEEDKRQVENNLPIWYLPCHLVFQKNKWRFCHDGRAPTKGICLNELLIGDLNLMVPLMDPINNLRSYIYAFSVDIEAFFHNVIVDERDRGAFRFLWWEDEQMKKLVEFMFLAFIFGSSSSPTVTSFVLRRHSENLEGVASAKVREIIRRYFYVDDGTGGDDDLDKCKTLCKELEEAMALGGFSLSKWIFSHKEMAEEEVEEEEAKEKRILGIVWDTKKDTLSVAIDEEKYKDEATTPRHVVQQQAALFDPLGIVAPFHLLGRQWTQKAMTGKWAWDIRTSEEVVLGFNEWTGSIKELRNLSIERSWNDPETVGGHEQLHIFTDASATGYGAVTYRRVIGKAGKIRVSFVCGKSHVVPSDTKRTSHHGSIPRLELVSALKGVDLSRAVSKSIQERIKEVWYWSDSNCVLTQIRDKTSSYKSFVANRLSKIHKKTDVDQWNFVDSNLNPADHCSRGIRAHEKEKWEIYLGGPKFLSKDEKDWPKMKLPPVKQCVIKAMTTKPTVRTEEEESWVRNWEITSETSGWAKKVRVWTKVVKMAKIWRIWKKGNRTRALTEKIAQIKRENADDRGTAESLILRSIQEKHFLEEKRMILEMEIKDPEDNAEVRKRKSCLAAHNPFMDKDKLIRVGSRIIHAQVDEEARCPIILPKEDPNVKDLVSHFHEKERHAGAKHTLCQLRQKYWILCGLQATKSAVSRCVRCQRLRKKPCEQKMAPLPAFRVSTSGPFHNCGIDLMGPFMVKLNGRANHKVWIAVFTCMESRAVHTEAVFKIDADSAINAIVRFKARRPGLKNMFSDRGTNFVAANSILRKELEELNKATSNHLIEEGIEWNFNPANAPHRGGAWERIIGLFKKHLTAALLGDTPTFDTFSTTVTEIEAILNRRPLTQISTDSRDIKALTPMDLLCPATSQEKRRIFVGAANNDAGSGMRNSWRRAQNRVNQFWKAFKRDYLSLLHSRSKWRNTKENLEKDDLVILVDETVERHRWKMGRIEKTFKSGPHVRRVEVKKADGKVVLRDRTKIVKLELEGDR